jgi:hypothetical protein
MSVSGASVLAANEREAKLKQWNQRKSIRDKTFDLLARLNTDRADEEDSLREVAIAICASERLLNGGEPPSSNPSVRDSIACSLSSFNNELYMNASCILGYTKDFKSSV